MRTFLILSGILIAAVLCNGQPHIIRQPDGKYYHPVHVSGSIDSRKNIVFIGDGFDVNDQTRYDKKVDEIFTSIFTSAPFNALKNCFNVWRVNVESSQSGINHLPHHPSSTAFGCTITDSPRSFKCEPSKYIDLATSYAPASNFTILLLNENTYLGYTSSRKSALSMHNDIPFVATHEFGHSVSDLGDEYDCMEGDICGTTAHPGTDVTLTRNLTTDTIRANIPWVSRISSGTKIPTVFDSTNGDAIGAWQGGLYFRYGIFRPQLNCRMRAVKSDFCAVCNALIMDDLSYITDFVSPAFGYIHSYTLRRYLQVQKFPVLLSPRYSSDSAKLIRVSLTGVENLDIRVVNPAHPNMVIPHKAVRNGSQWNIEYTDDVKHHYAIQLALKNQSAAVYLDHSTRIESGFWINHKKQF